MSRQPMRVLLVDDDPLVLTALKSLFKTTPELRVVGTVSDGSQVLAYLTAHEIDAVLMDIRMPQVNGISAARKIKERFPQVRVVLMSTLEESNVSSHVRNAGADGFVSKFATATQLRVNLAPSSGNAVEDDRNDSAAKVPLQAALSDREFAVALLVADGMRNEDIARVQNLSINSVKTYVSRVLKKLGLSNRVQLANHVNSDYERFQSTGRSR